MPLANPERTCVVCRRTFIAWRDDQVYCSSSSAPDSCKTQLHSVEMSIDFLVEFAGAIKAQEYHCFRCGIEAERGRARLASGDGATEEGAEGAGFIAKCYALLHGRKRKSGEALYPLLLTPYDPSTRVVASCGPCRNIWYRDLSKGAAQASLVIFDLAGLPALVPLVQS